MPALPVETAAEVMRTAAETGKVTALTIRHAREVVEPSIPDGTPKSHAEQVAEADEAAQGLVEEMERRKPGVKADLNASKTKARWIAARPAPWGREADRLDRCVRDGTQHAAV